MSEKSVFHYHIVVVSPFLQPLTCGLLHLLLGLLVLRFAPHCFSFFSASRRNRASRTLRFPFRNFPFSNFSYNAL